MRARFLSYISAHSRAAAGCIFVRVYFCYVIVFWYDSESLKFSIYKNGQIWFSYMKGSPHLHIISL